LQEFDEGKCICPPGSVIIDFQELPEKVKKQDMLLLDDILDWIANVLRTGLEQGEFDFSDSVETQAEMVVETLLGTRLVSVLLLMYCFSKVRP